MTNPRLNDTVPAPDGGSYGALVRRPASGSGPGLVLVQEIFGVSDYLAFSAERLARLGYTVLAPDLFWRIEAGADVEDGDLDRAMGLAGQLDAEQAVRDLVTALDHLRGRDDVDGRTGVVGFCLGGTLAFHVAAGAAPDACVAYYGSGIPDAVERMDAITCPTLYHFGLDDAYIARDDVERVAAAAAGRDHVDVETYPTGGHAFDNAFSEMFHQPRNAVTAWGITAAFLERHLPTRPPR